MINDQYNCDDVIDFLELVTKSRQKRKLVTPLLVHCSAGVGRTGTFIAMEHIMKILHETKQCDALSVVANIRLDRCHLVQHVLQYQWLCSAMARYAERQGHPFEVMTPPKKQVPKTAEEMKEIRAAEKEAAQTKAEAAAAVAASSKKPLRRQSCGACFSNMILHSSLRLNPTMTPRCCVTSSVRRQSDW
jgi:hypothetical protein